MKHMLWGNICRTVPARLRSGIVMLLAATALVLAPSAARASCSFDRFNSQGTYLVSVPTSLVNDPNIAVGSVLYTSSSTGISQQVNFGCNNSNGNGWGLINEVGNTPGTSQNIFPTGVTGVGYRVLQKGDYIFPYPYFDLGRNSSWYESDAVTIELVKTGTIADGSVLNSGPLASFKAGQQSSYILDAVIRLTNALTFTAPACQVNATAVNVVLPTVTRGAFNGVNSTTGTTPFQIGLTCSRGAMVRITLDTASPVAGKTGVIAPSGGSTSGVAVQVLDSSGTNPVTFGVPTVLGATPDGALTVNYYARYFQTGSTVGAGTLNATATFTLSYQ